MRQEKRETAKEIINRLREAKHDPALVAMTILLLYFDEIWSTCKSMELTCNDGVGLCLMNLIAQNQNLMTIEEKMAFDEYLKRHKTLRRKLELSPYYWPPGQKKPRRKYLRKHIRRLWKKAEKQRVKK